MSQVIDMSEWLSVALEATKETATSALACEGVEITEYDGNGPEVPEGAYIPLTVGKQCLHVGLLSDSTGCKQMTRSMLCLEPDEDDPNEEDVIDAVGEIVNMLAGIMQRKLSDPPVVLGLPIFVRGHVLLSNKNEMVRATLVMDSVRTELIMLRRQDGGL